MSKSIIADVVLGLQHGDEGKGKVTHHLLKSGEYNYCLRFNGGGNAGHTIYHEGKKYVTHYIPSGVFHGIKSIIGPGCVVNLDKLEQEIQELEDGGVNVCDFLFIDKRTHITTAQHIEEDSQDSKKDWTEAAIGTTKSGNGPTYRDKYARGNLTFDIWLDTQVKTIETVNLIDPTIPENESANKFYNQLIKQRMQDNHDKWIPFLIDTFEEFHDGKLKTILCEGAQGFELDIDWGDYPYVTSSHCGVGSAVLNGIPPKSIRNVYGVIKAYETYVGAKAFQNENEVCKLFQVLGEEFGATTGRLRQTDFLHLPRLIRAIKMNSVSHLIVNKCDIFEQACKEINKYPLFSVRGTMNPEYLAEPFLQFQSFQDWKTDIQNTVMPLGVNKIFFSSSPYEI
jgi:adenylosuccinate synthase|tara:strand:- start:14116 stop:15303 length:1188 start_codon:yes stop_codon:yes gene_type:complete